MKSHDNLIYFCKECNQFYKICYELDKVNMCARCFSEDLLVLSEPEANKLIRLKRLKRLQEISNN